METKTTIARRKQIRAALRNSPGMTTMELAQKLGLKPTQVRYALKPMEASGEVFAMLQTGSCYDAALWHVNKHWNPKIERKEVVVEKAPLVFERAQ